MARRVIASLLTAAVIVGALWWLLNRGPQRMDPKGIAGPSGVALLIPGYGGGDPFGTLRPALASSGWAAQVIDIGDGHGDISAYAQSVAAAARQASVSGASVALVGYSEGGLIARAAINDGAAPFVGRVVTIGSPHDGTRIAGLGALLNKDACPLACQQMAPGSDFLDSLPVAGDPSRWLALYTEQDSVVTPPESAALDGATVVKLQDACPGRSADHGQLVSDSYVSSAVRVFLASGAVPSGCLA